MREKRRLFFKGGVQAEITGLGRERFFNIAARRELFVTGIGTDRDGHVLFWTTGEDYKKMKPAARKAGVRLFLRKKYGLPFFLFRNRKRKPLAAGFICFFLLLYGLSFFIWDISFEGNLRFTDQTDVGHRIDHRVVRRRACGNRTIVRPPETVFHRNLAGAHIRDHLGDEERAISGDFASLDIALYLLVECLQSTYA